MPLAHDAISFPLDIDYIFEVILVLNAHNWIPRFIFRNVLTAQEVNILWLKMSFLRLLLNLDMILNGV